MEDYVTYEQAVKLRELGFDWECNHVYYGENATHLFPDERKKLCECFRRNSNNTDYRFSAPTLNQAAKWLREVKGIAVCVQSFDNNKDPRYGKFWWKEYFLPNCKERGQQWVEWWISGQHPIFPNYEEALCDGISKMLELIINKK